VIDSALAEWHQRPWLVHLIYGVIKSGQPFDMQKAMPKLDLQDGI